MSRRLKKETQKLKSCTSLEWMLDNLCDNEYHHYKGCVVGPEGSLYAGGVFFVDVTCPQEYPMQAPVFRFETPILHPMVQYSPSSEQGSVALFRCSHWYVG